MARSATIQLSSGPIESEGTSVCQPLFLREEPRLETRSSRRIMRNSIVRHYFFFQLDLFDIQSGR